MCRFNRKTAQPGGFSVMESMSAESASYGFKKVPGFPGGESMSAESAGYGFEKGAGLFPT